MSSTFSAVIKVSRVITAVDYLLPLGVFAGIFNKFCFLTKTAKTAKTAKTQHRSFASHKKLTKLFKESKRRVRERRNYQCKRVSYKTRFSRSDGQIFRETGSCAMQLLENTFILSGWRGVATWRWVANDDNCGICRMPFDASCPDCKIPGDDCPLVWGQCSHCFHIHCIMKWLNSQQTSLLCPMCRQEWKFKE